MEPINLFKDYENARLDELYYYKLQNPDKTVLYDDLKNTEVAGLPIGVTRNAAGGLEVTFVPDTHLLAIGATRSGKTTGYVVPTINVLLQKKNKSGMVISDPKQELYRQSAAEFEKQGYRVILLDFNNYRHSDCWNPLTKFYRLYQKYLAVEKSVQAVETPSGNRNVFEGKVYEDQFELECAVSERRDEYFDAVEKGITALSHTVVSALNTKDPFWEDSARDLFCAILYGMLEDSESGIITEDTFSFDTMMRVFDSFGDDANGSYDNGYFKNRPESSRAYRLAHKCILEQAPVTRRCITSTFATKTNKFRDTSVRRITCTNTFEMNSLDDAQPTVIFLSYRDEESLHYEVISMFLSNLYTELIAISRKKKGRLERPFYFMLDEFGNLPKFADFDKVISACGGRNIWFLLILQSYAQLGHVYGSGIAEVIKDNLNTHVFFGTNNPETKREFSRECGMKTIISPTSALNGQSERIERYDKETVALVPVCKLDHIPPGDCIVTAMGSDVLWSHYERSYLCPEFVGVPSEPTDRQPRVRFSDPRYNYKPVRIEGSAEKEVKNPFEF